MSNSSALAIAVEWNHRSLISTLLEHKASSSYPRIGLAMIVAARNRNHVILRMFLEYERTTNYIEKSAEPNDIALEYSVQEAAEFSYLDIVRLLLEYSDDEETRSKLLSVAVREAIAHNHQEMITALQTLAQPLEGCCLLGDALSAAAGKRPSFDSLTCTHTSNVDDVATLFDELLHECNSSKIYLNYQLKALKEALSAGNRGAARFLLDKDITSTLSKTETDILQVAINAIWNNDFRSSSEDDMNSSINLFELLIAHGAPLNQRDGHGNTPVFYACARPNLSIVQILIKAGADPWLDFATLPSNNLQESISPSEEQRLKKFNLLKIALDAHLNYNIKDPI